MSRAKGTTKWSPQYSLAARRARQQREAAARADFEQRMVASHCRRLEGAEFEARARELLEREQQDNNGGQSWL